MQIKLPESHISRLDYEKKLPRRETTRTNKKKKKNSKARDDAFFFFWSTNPESMYVAPLISIRLSSNVSFRRVTRIISLFWTYPIKKKKIK